MQFRRNNLPSLSVKLNPVSTELQDGPKSAPYIKSATSQSARFYLKSSTVLMNNNNKGSRTNLTKGNNIESSYSFLPKLTQYQVSRSSRWEILGEDITKPDLTGENDDRNPRIKELLKEFLKLKDQIAWMPERDKTDHIAHMFDIAEAILALYKISVNTVSVAQLDSILELAPLKSKADLLRGFIVLIPEICRFPYSFYTKIDLISFSFGGNLNIIKRSNRDMIEKKLFNGVFPLGALNTDEQIVSHFYKTLAFHLRTTVPDFEEKLTAKTRPAKSSLLLANTLNFAPPYESPKKKHEFNNLEEYGKLFKKIILQPKSFLKNEPESVSIRANILKEILQDVDADGINEKFWASLDSYSHTELTNNNGFLTQSKLPVRAL